MSEEDGERFLCLPTEQSVAPSVFVFVLFSSNPSDYLAVVILFLCRADSLSLCFLFHLCLYGCMLAMYVEAAVNLPSIDKLWRGE